MITKELKQKWSNDGKRNEYLKDMDNWTLLSDDNDIRTYKMNELPYIKIKLKVQYYSRHNYMYQEIATRQLTHDENDILPFIVDDSTILNDMKLLANRKDL